MRFLEWDIVLHIVIDLLIFFLLVVIFFFIKRLGFIVAVNIATVAVINFSFYENILRF